MRKLAALVLLFCACAKTPPAAVNSVSDAFAGHVSFSAPEGWLREDGAFGPDRSARFIQPPYSIVLQLLGGKGSRFPDPSSVFAGDSAPTQDIAGARGIGEVAVAGRKATLYLRTYTTFDKTHGGTGAAIPGREEFIVLEAGNRFFLVSHFHDGVQENDAVHRQWPLFLQSLNVLKNY